MQHFNMGHPSDNDDSEQTENTGASGRRVRTCGICFKAITYQWRRHFKTRHPGRDRFEAPN